MNGINVIMYFLKNNKIINVNISEVLTLKENINNVIKLIGDESLNLDCDPIVYSRYDQLFVEVNETVNKLNIYPNCYLYVL